jgi:hypothetical protein
MKHTWVGMFPADEEEEMNYYCSFFFFFCPLTCDSETPMTGARFGLCAGRTLHYNNYAIKYKLLLRKEEREADSTEYFEDESRVSISFPTLINFGAFGQKLGLCYYDFLVCYML